MPAQRFFAAVIRKQLYSEREAFNVAVELVGSGPCDFSLLEYKPDFGVEKERSLIEIERANKHFPLVENHGFGMQAGFAEAW